MPTGGSRLGAALGLPPALAILGVLAIAVAERAGYTPLSRDRPRNGAEAAVRDNAAEVVRFLALGDDPSRLYAIRQETAPSPSPRRATTIETIVWHGRVELFQLLEHEGIVIDAAMRDELFCLATDLGRAEMAAHLRVGAAGDVACEPGQTAARVAGRAP